MKVLYITTIVDTMDFFIDHIKMLQNMGHIVEIACNINNAMSTQNINVNCKAHDIPFSRVPLSKDNIIAYKKLKELIKKENYDMIHCHTPNAAVITRLICRKIRRSGLKVIYTAHGFHFYKGAPIKNWLLYYPIEKICSYWTDVLITINREDYEFSKKKMHAKRLEYVPGVGIDLKKFDEINVNQIEKRRELAVPPNAKLLLSVGELNKNKNHETVIKAIANMKDVYYIIAGSGNLQEHLELIIKQYNLNERVKLLGFRNDIGELCQCADIFVFPSFREGLSVALMEAMANQLPVVCSKIRGNIDLIDPEGGEYFSPYNINELKDKLMILVQMSKQELISKGEYNSKKIKEFDKSVVENKIKRVYKEVCEKIKK